MNDGIQVKNKRLASETGQRDRFAGRVKQRKIRRSFANRLGFKGRSNISGIEQTACGYANEDRTHDLFCIIQAPRSGSANRGWTAPGRRAIQKQFARCVRNVGFHHIGM
jgi:hypothetical protein